MTNQNKEILLVEDNPDDVELTRIAFAEAGSEYVICWTSTCPS